MNKFLKILIGVILIIIGIGIGYFWGFTNEKTALGKKLNSIHPLRESNAGYKFIDPLLAYIIPSADQESDMFFLKNKITNFINSDKKNNGLIAASVFFYDLNRGRWVGVDEMEKYNPASMLKVVIMVSYFKEAEINPDILNKQLVYTKEIDSLIKQDPSNSVPELKIGASYKIEDLIEKMIIDSDNGAYVLLNSNMSRESLDSVYNALNIENPNEKNGFVISPRIYSLFFRILYSSTYVDNVKSEKALDILSKTNFSDGLVAGVPKDIIVAHKFGEYVNELHDCGIVYYPKNPYLLCVMTRGNNLNNLKDTIKNISSIVYQSYSNLK